MKLVAIADVFKKSKRKFNFLSLPLYVLMVLILLPLPLIICKVAFKIPSLGGRPLVGTPNTYHQFPSLRSINSIFTREWQKQSEAWLDFNIPFRSFLIRFHNQIYYSLFSKDYMYSGNIIVGRSNYLFEIAYLKMYCNSDHKVFNQEAFIKWRNKLQALNDFFQEHGQKFIYIISPSKAGYFPEYLPKHYQCEEPFRPGYAIGEQVVKTANFPHINAVEILSKNKQKYRELLFPRGGTHWTMLSAALIFPDLLKKISDSQHELPNLKFTASTDFHPIGTDSDLLDLSNLLFPQKNYAVPKLLFSQVPAKHPSKPLNVAFIGGSFSGQLIQIAIQEKLFAKIDYYYYLSLRHFQKAKGEISLEHFYAQPQNVDLKNPNTYQDILNADVVVFEENETNLNSGYLTQLLDTLKIKPHESV